MLKAHAVDDDLVQDHHARCLQLDVWRQTLFPFAFIAARCGTWIFLEMQVWSAARGPRMAGYDLM